MLVVVIVPEMVVVTLVLVLVEEVLGAGTVSVVVVLLVVLVLVVGGIVVEELRSRGHAPGAGAFFIFSTVASFLTSSPPKMAQYRFGSVPTASTMPTWPVNGVGSVTPEPLQTALMTLGLMSTSLHGSLGDPAPRYLNTLIPGGLPSGVQPAAGSVNVALTGRNGSSSKMLSMPPPSVG